MDFSATDHERNRRVADRGSVPHIMKEIVGELIVEFSATDRGRNRGGADRGVQCHRS